MNQSTVNSQRLTVKALWCNIQSKQFLLHLTFYILLLTSSSAQSVSACLDRDKILLGEQITLQFTLGNISEGSAFVANWPLLNDTLNHTEIIKRTPVDTINVNGYNTYTQNFTLTSFDSGRWQLGPFTFVIQNKTTGKQIQLATSPLYLTVLPVDVSSLQDYHPIKDIIDVDVSFNWTPVMIAIAVIVLAIIIFIIIKKAKKKMAAAPKIILKGTPLQRALDKLYVLEKEQLDSTGAIKKFHSETDMIIRQYFEEMMRVNAMQLTATELFLRLKVFMQDAKLRSQFQQLFELNASVKFAKYMPQPEESKNTLKEIIKSLHQIDDTVNLAKNNADRLVQKY